MTRKFQDQDEDLIQRLLDEGMPQRRKEKKAKDMDEMQTEAGACIFIPAKRKRKIRYPKNFDPAMPGEMPDPERWLPKWQQSKYKKMAKKKGIYLKGA